MRRRRMISGGVGWIQVLAIRAVGVLVIAFSLPTAFADRQEAYEHKSDTGRSISFQVRVGGTPEQLFRMWISPDGIKRFLGSGSNVDPRVGGLYEIDFGLGPDGNIAGPRGNRILRYEPGRALDFEWTMPAFAKELNTELLPTWVEIQFEPYGPDSNQTIVKLTHYGFGVGPVWNQCVDFFERGWFDILFRLKLSRTYFAFSGQ